MSEDVREFGALVEDRHDDDSDEQNSAAVINLPSVPARDWEAYEGTTVAEDNPEYDPEAGVIVVAFCDALSENHPDWDGDSSLPLTELDCPHYAFPPNRLRRIGHIAEDQPTSGGGTTPASPTETQDSDADSSSESQEGAETESTASAPTLTSDQEDLRDRLEETAEVTVEKQSGAAVLVATKLGGEHRIHPDGTVEDGPLADRFSEIASEYLANEP